MEHIKAAGNYANHRRPDTIVLAGDWNDLPSLSLWDSVQKKAAEKRRLLSDDPDIEGDIEVGKRGFKVFTEAVHGTSRTYRPRIVLTKGNHEHRLARFREEYPHLGSALSDKLFGYKEYGIEAHPFLKPVIIEGVAFCHFFVPDVHGRVMQTKKGQSSARQQVLNVGMSAVAGHKQGLDVAVLERQSGRQRGIIAGSFYQHDEEYVGPQGNAHWRGCLYLHQLQKGDFDLMELSLSYLIDRWG